MTDLSTMRLFAISDLHLAHATNRAALDALPAYPRDWLIVAGDVAEKPETVADAFAVLAARFARVIWVPGNHELWTSAPEGGRPALAGEAKYHALVEIARKAGIVTPEDPYPVWQGPGGPCLIAPLFLLYDYSFRPPGLAREDVVAWAREGRAVCADEIRLDPAPYASREDWCAARVGISAARLEARPHGLPTILVNHYPLRADLIHIPRIPRFTPWCGTRATHDWHRRFDARVAISGHLHVRRSDIRDGTRFEEVSLGYPKQWQPRRGIAPYLRQILP